MASSIQPCPLPERALLAQYTARGAYTDCYVADLTGSVSHADYVEAFYTGALFKVERRLLAWFLGRPSTDAQVRELAAGTLDTFAAWKVEERSADQVLLREIGGRTRSWLMAVTVGSGSSARTRLYFGSAVVPVTDTKTGTVRLGVAFKALLGFHKLYSRALLAAAAARLRRAGAVA
jgi:hypothetical protein